MARFKNLTIHSSDRMGLDLQLDDFILADDTCRVIQQLVWDLDTTDIESQYSDLGQSAYHPKMLLSVIFYGYSQGLRSGRKLSRACETDIRYIYLSQGYRPSKTTLNDFRREHYRSFEQLFGQIVRQCMELGLLRSTDPCFGDGTKIRANASAKRSKRKAGYERWLANLEEDIAELSASEVSESEDELPPDQPDTLAQKQALADKIKDRLERFAEQDEEQKVNLTDPDAHFMKGKKGDKDTYYNTQVVVTDQQLIVHNHVCTSSSDRHQLQPAMEGVKRNMQAYPQRSAWDCGYSCFANEEFLAANSIEAFIPDQDFGKSFDKRPFHRRHFQYDPQQDQYICPKGHPLVFFRHKNYDGYRNRVYQGTHCQHCPCKAQCTPANARTIQREVRQPLRDQMYQRLQTSQGKRLSAMRKYCVEPVFGHLKHNLGYQQFLLRSSKLVEAEFNIMCIAFNLAKMARLLTEKARLFLSKPSLGLYLRAASRLNSIVNELLTSLTRRLMYKCFYNVIG